MRAGFLCRQRLSKESDAPDMINSGAKWVDEPVVVDRNIISSLFPDDLPHFCPAIIAYLSQKK
ncbi:MAG: DJ-1/PfpI family protein [Parachlamydia sp.]|nr:DJ-1/PfpI family protein [Parachlamydia sp.]